MTTEEAMQYENAVIASAIDWAEGNASIDSPVDLCIIADHYRFRLPVHMRHFQYSHNPNEFCSTGAHKAVGKTLCKLRDAIFAQEQ